MHTSSTSLCLPVIALLGRSLAAVAAVSGLGAAEAGPPGKRAASIQEPNLALTLGSGPGGWAVRWTLLGARRVDPRPGAAGDTVYDEVYPGVRLTLESRRYAVAYRFDVARHADPGLIRVRYDGADEVAEENGGLRVTSHGGVLHERGLRCFQPGSSPPRKVDCSYRVTRVPAGAFEVSLVVGPFDRASPLVIDPEIVWSSFLGGSGEDTAYDIAIDTAGDIYVTGFTVSSNFPSSGGFDSTGSGQDAFVSKVTAGASLAWSTYLGGSGIDYANSVAVDAAGNVYLAGTTRSGDFPILGGFDSTLAGIGDAFVAKVDASGSSLAWSSLLGGSGDDLGTGIEVDAAANLYVAGQTHSSDFPSFGGFDTAFGGAQDAFVAKVDASGSSLAWSSFLGGSGEDWGNDLRIDSLGNLFVTGATQSTDFPSTGGFDAALGGSADAFVTKVDASGSIMVWSSYLGGSTDDYGTSVTLDGAGDVLVAGNTSSSDFPAAGGFDPGFNGMFDAFVAKVDASGSSLAWSSYLGGSDVDYGLAVSANALGDVLVSGSTFSSDFPSSGGFDTNLGGTQDAFVARVDASGSSLTWSSYLGDAGDELGWGVAGYGGTVVTTGQTSSPNYPSAGGFDPSYNGGIDAFVTYIGECGDGVCDAPETVCSCAADCTGVPGTCGDDCCNATESPCDCPVDCGSDTCGNACCGTAENPCDCPADCGSDTCGNACCGAAEDCEICPLDCGGCAEPSPDATPDAPVTSPDATPDAPAASPDATPDAPDAPAAAPAADGCGCQVGRSARGASLIAILFSFLLPRALRRRRSHGRRAANESFTPWA